jgi:hypothetical protein
MHPQESLCEALQLFRSGLSLRQERERHQRVGREQVEGGGPIPGVRQDPGQRQIPRCGQCCGQRRLGATSPAYS